MGRHCIPPETHRRQGVDQRHARQHCRPPLPESVHPAVNLQQESMEVDTSPVLYLPSYIFAVQLTYSSICDNPLMRAINLQQP